VLDVAARTRYGTVTEAPIGTGLAPSAPARVAVNPVTCDQLVRPNAASPADPDGSATPSEDDRSTTTGVVVTPGAVTAICSRRSAAGATPFANARPAPSPASPVTAVPKPANTSCWPEPAAPGSTRASRSAMSGFSTGSFASMSACVGRTVTPRASTARRDQLVACAVAFT
jgi:hypothetical protein